MIRSKRYKLIEYIGKDNGQLFDLESDPDELKDVWSDPDYAEAKTTLRKDLTDWFITSTVDATGWWMQGSIDCRSGVASSMVRLCAQSGCRAP